METFWMIQSRVCGEDDLWVEYLTFNTEQEAWKSYDNTSPWRGPYRLVRCEVMDVKNE